MSNIRQINKASKIKQITEASKKRINILEDASIQGSMIAPDTITSNLLAASLTNSMLLEYSIITGDYVILDNDRFSLIVVNSSLSTVTVTLPELANNENRVIVIKRFGANNVTIARNGTDTIDIVAADHTISVDGDSVTVYGISGSINTWMTI